MKDPKKTMKRAVITIIIFLFLLAACDNAAIPSHDPPTDTITYSAGGPDVSRFLGWEWAKEGSEFTYLFQPDGTISTIHCCGLEFDNSFGYLFRGNVLVTYGSEMDFDEIEVANFTFAADNLSFTLNNGTKFIRGETWDTYSSGLALVLSNVLLGTWNGDDGKKYIFDSDAGLFINNDQYGYLVRNSELLTLGSLVDGTQAVLQKYKFKLSGNMLSLQYIADVKTNTINLSKAE